MAVRWFDSHVHMERYSTAAIDGMLARAKVAGVEPVMAVSTSPASSERTMLLPGPILKAVGVHPTGADAEALRWLGATALHASVAAIGECGFDDGGPNWEIQAAVFAAQVNLAREAGKPLILHIDGATAWERLVAGGEALDGVRVIRHYFRGDEAQVRWHVERGHYVSFGRPLLRDASLRGLAGAVPKELLLIETDTYPVAGRTTEPRDLVDVGVALAATRGWTVERCAEQLWANAENVVGLAGGPNRARPAS